MKRMIVERSQPSPGRALIEERVIHLRALVGTAATGMSSFSLACKALFHL